MAYELPPRAGSETVTTGSACAVVSWRRRLLFEARVAMPPPTTMTATATPTMAAMCSPRWRSGGLEPSDDMRFSDGGRRERSVGRRSAMRSAMEGPVYDAKYDWNEDQCGNGCEGQSADHGATERRVLLSAFT